MNHCYVFVNQKVCPRLFFFFCALCAVVSFPSQEKKVAELGKVRVKRNQMCNEMAPAPGKI